MLQGLKLCIYIDHIIIEVLQGTILNLYFFFQLPVSVKAHAGSSKSHSVTALVFVAFVEDNATMSSIRYFENHASYFVQNRRK